jgi:hypothetical protein
MTLELLDDYRLALSQAGIESKVSLLAVHMCGVDDEGEEVLEQLTSLRTHAYQADARAARAALIEMTIHLARLQQHIRATLPELQRQLNIPAR